MRTGDSGMIDHCQVLDATSGHSGGGRSHGVATRMWLVLVAGLGLLWFTGPARAAEPVQAFVDGLRDRGYYDTALAYLDQLEQQGKLPVELRDRAYTHLDDLVTSLREAGRYAFRADEKLRKSFVSRYLRRKRKRNAGDTGVAPVSPAE